MQNHFPRAVEFFTCSQLLHRHVLVYCLQSMRISRQCKRRIFILLLCVFVLHMLAQIFWQPTGKGCRIQFQCDIDSFGTEYGGRVLPLPVIRHITQLQNPLIISYGVGQDVSFELCLACVTGSAVHLFDPSPHAESHVNYLNLVTNRPWLFGYFAKTFTDPAVQEVSAGLQYKDYWEIIRRSSVRRNQLVLHKEAFGHTDGELIFAQSENQGKAGSFSANRRMRDGKGKHIVVKARSYESTVRAFSKVPDILKVDVEGLEPEFLKNLIKVPELMPTIVNVDFDSICCCMASDRSDCDRLSKLGWEAINAMEKAGYSVDGTNSSYISDVTFFMHSKLLP